MDAHCDDELRPEGAGFIGRRLAQSGQSTSHSSKSTIVVSAFDTCPPVFIFSQSLGHLVLPDKLVQRAEQLRCRLSFIIVDAHSQTHQTIPSPPIRPIPLSPGAGRLHLCPLFAQTQTAMFLSIVRQPLTLDPSSTQSRRWPTRPADTQNYLGPILVIFHCDM